MPFATKSKGHCSDCTFQNSGGWVAGQNGGLAGAYYITCRTRRGTYYILRHSKSSTWLYMFAGIGSLPTGVVEDLVKEEDRKEVRFGWISLDFENEGGTKEEEKLGGGAHQGQTDWGKITGATDL
ncbi:hypothetical protein BY996DRAFT_6452499 [Phakopsora pachyrhizi]|nr:hypothetical protein BY996DRAFT_6452499 [Phakopsora pachyrhizi]